MSYDGHRITIGEIDITNDWIAPGTFNITPTKRIIDSWTDADLVEHQDILETRKMVIEFSIRERTLADQLTIAEIFSEQEDISVSYYDDISGTYKNGTFYMDAPKFSHLNTKTGQILYAATPIKLTEY